MPGVRVRVRGWWVAWGKDYHLEGEGDGGYGGFASMRTGYINTISSSAKELPHTYVNTEVRDKAVWLVCLEITALSAAIT